MSELDDFIDAKHKFPTVEDLAAAVRNLMWDQRRMARESDVADLCFQMISAGYESLSIDELAKRLLVVRELQVRCAQLEQVLKEKEDDEAKEKFITAYVLNRDTIDGRGAVHEAVRAWEAIRDEMDLPKSKGDGNGN